MPVFIDTPIPCRAELEVVVVDALGQSRRPRGVDHHQIRLRRDDDVGVGQGLFGGTDLAFQTRFELGERDDVFAGHRVQLFAHALDFGQELVVDDEQACARMVDDSGEYLPAQARVDAEECRAADPAAAVEREQLEVVLEQHGHVRWALLVAHAESSEHEVRHARRLVAKPAVAPAPRVLHEEDLVGGLGVLGAHADLLAKGEFGLGERNRCLGHRGAILPYDRPMPKIDDLLQLMARLRDPNGGCAWDLAQSFATIAPYTIEEAYEVDDAIRRSAWAELCEELGDLLLQVVFHAQLAREAGLFSFDDVVDALSAISSAASRPRR